MFDIEYYVQTRRLLFGYFVASVLGIALCILSYVAINQPDFEPKKWGLMTLFFITAAGIRELIWRGQFYYLDEFLSIKSMQRGHFFIFGSIQDPDVQEKIQERDFLFNVMYIYSKIPTLLVIFVFAGISAAVFSQHTTAITFSDLCFFIIAGVVAMLPPFVNALLLYVVPAVGTFFIAVVREVPISTEIQVVFFLLTICQIGSVAFIKRMWLGGFRIRSRQLVNLPWVQWVVHGCIIFFLIGLTYPTFSGRNIDQLMTDSKDFVIYSVKESVKALDEVVTPKAAPEVLSEAQKKHEEILEYMQEKAEEQPYQTQEDEKKRKERNEMGSYTAQGPGKMMPREMPRMNDQGELVNQDGTPFILPEFKAPFDIQSDEVEVLDEWAHRARYSDSELDQILKSKNPQQLMANTGLSPTDLERVMKDIRNRKNQVSPKQLEILNRQIQSIEAMNGVADGKSTAESSLNREYKEGGVTVDEYLKGRNEVSDDRQKLEEMLPLSKVSLLDQHSVGSGLEGLGPDAEKVAEEFESKRIQKISSEPYRPRVTEKLWYPKHQKVAEKLELKNNDIDQILSEKGLPITRISDAYYQNQKEVLKWENRPDNKKARQNVEWLKEYYATQKAEQEMREAELKRKIDRYLNKVFGFIQFIILLPLVYLIYRWAFGKRDEKAEVEMEKRERHKKLDEAWEEVQGVKKKKLSAREEIIQTYLSLIDYLQYTPMSKPDWRASWDYINDFSENMPNQKDKMTRFTQYYCDVFYGGKDVGKSELEEFRSHTKKLFRSVKAKI
ncbi:MAG: hypothetical protein CL677_08770 [Bdellovibrionaceae bacterium]|nr:hypothetical protein [Pseudobdellovibrionaceae bacterium]